MGIHDLLREVAETYDANAGSRRDVVGQQVLRGVAKRLDLGLPSGLVARGYGGQTTPAATPWIGVFDPEINSDAGKGLYLAYIFAADLLTVSLTLQQGITHLEDRLGRGQARQTHLRRQAARLRAAVASQRRNGWFDEPELRHHADRPRAYEAASVIARRYETAALPDEMALQDDLEHAAELLKRAHVADRLWQFEDSPTFQVNYEFDGHVVNEGDALAGFSPKDSSDYIANIPARQQIKKRHHEALVKSFGQHVASCGYIPTTRLMHPKDLVLHRAGQSSNTSDEWLVEAKVVRGGNPTEAVRQAVGQLYEYSHFFYRERKLPEPHLVGLFTEDVGVYSGYLEERGIASIWRDGDNWRGSPRAIGWGMAG
ncbi:MrcB family domain-containing protein [Streptomyces sp. NPDC088551]|uniref:MrcB family domain-containing protein n=1 Tax=Streptomyces sp. NPDC088551 TaxID=3365863 RepID=UPI0038296A1C